MRFPKSLAIFASNNNNKEIAVTAKLDYVVYLYVLIYLNIYIIYSHIYNIYYIFSHNLHKNPRKYIFPLKQGWGTPSSQSWKLVNQA